MKKQLTLVAILFMFLSTTLFAPVIIAEETESQSTFIPIFNSKIDFEIENEIKDSIIPVNSTTTVEFKVKYKLEIGNLIFRLLTKRRIGRLILFGPGYIMKFLKGDPKASINLSVECPSYCTAKLEPESVNLAFNNVFETADVKLTFYLNETAPAFKKSDIKINADFSGLWTIKEATNSTTVTFLPAYVGLLNVITPANNATIPPLQNYTFPINLTNIGNGRSRINISIIDSDNWTILLNKNDFALETDGSDQVSLTVVKPPKNFVDKSIEIVITPLFDEDLSYTGTPVKITYTFYNDGSLKGEEEGINLTNIAIIIVVIIILLVIIYFLLKRRK